MFCYFRPDRLQLIMKELMKLMKARRFLVTLISMIAGLSFGVYLSDATGEQITITWFTEEPSDSYLIVYDGSNEWIHSETEVTLHRFRVSGLRPGTSYAYSVKSMRGDKLVYRGGGVLTTSPQRNSPFRFAAYGDSRSDPEVHKAITAAIAAENASLVINTGDLVSSDDDMEGWKDFMKAVESLSNSVYYSTIGNHESDAVNYLRFFAYPGNERYYSFWYGDIFFVCLNTNESFDKYSQQYIWFLTELEKAAVLNPAFTIVFFHHPPYSFGPHGDHFYVKEYLVSVFESYGVDIVLNGHDHGYQRMEKNGVNYIITAGGGAPLYEILPEPGLKAYGQSHHYVLFEYTLDGISIQAKSPQGEIIDSIFIRRH